MRKLSHLLLHGWPLARELRGVPTGGRANLARSTSEPTCCCRLGKKVREEKKTKWGKQLRQWARMAVGQAWRTPGLGPNSSQEARWATSTALQWYFDASNSGFTQCGAAANGTFGCGNVALHLKQPLPLLLSWGNPALISSTTCQHLLSAQCCCCSYFVAYHLLEVICQSEGMLPVSLEQGNWVSTGQK